jgi:hypothetical protein
MEDLKLLRRHFQRSEVPISGFGLGATFEGSTFTAGYKKIYERAQKKYAGLAAVPIKAAGAPRCGGFTTSWLFNDPIHYVEQILQLSLNLKAASAPVNPALCCVLRSWADKPASRRAAR